jgi:putative transposase
MCRGNNKLPILANNADKRQFYHLLSKFKQENQVDILHYCIMDNHIHLVVWLNQNSNLSRLMKQISLAYYYHYAKKYDYCGHLWQGRFKSIIIKSDSQALQCGKYIELNPVRAGIIAEPGQYSFSSYKYYALGEQDYLITPSPAYQDLSVGHLAKRQIYANFLIDKETLPLEKRKGTFPSKAEGKRPLLLKYLNT